MFEFWEMLTNLQQEDDPEVREVITMTLQLLGNARGFLKIFYHFFFHFKRIILQNFLDLMQYIK